MDPRPSLLCVVSLAAIGCGNGLSRCIDDRVTIEQGIYGQLVSGCDTPDCSPSYAVGLSLRVYDSDPTPATGPPGNAVIYDEGTTLTPIARVASGGEGFYEIALPAGTYYFCANSCARINLSASPPRVRYDWTSGPGGGFWRRAVRADLSSMSCAEELHA
jgi:hypothetical protein